MARGGWALLVVMFGIVLLSAIGLALGLAAAYDSTASANVRRSQVALHAAEAGLERAMLELPQVPEWDDILSGTAGSTFRDGAPSGRRDLPGGGSVVLEQWLNLANCANSAPCDLRAMNAVTDERRWGENNPRWRLFGWGWLSSLVPGLDPRSDAYLLVLVGDDPTETDGDPSRDGPSAETGRGVLLLRASAFAGGGSVRTVEATIARSARRSRPEGYAAQRGPSVSADPVSAAPGGALARRGMTLKDGGMVER